MQLLTAAGTIVAFMGFSDLSIWDLVVQYVKPLVGSLTVGGALAVAINFVKFHSEV